MSIGQRIRRENVTMVGKLAVVTAGMFAFGYALVPMYKRHLRDDGHQHPVAVRAAGAGRRQRRQERRCPTTRRSTRTRTITVEFDANSRGPWDFKPAQRSIQVHPGELTR